MPVAERGAGIVGPTVTVARSPRWSRPRAASPVVELIPDEPLPLASEAKSQSSTRTTRRALSLVTVAWVFGSVWATATGGAPLTLFAQTLHASEFQFGLLSALPFIS